jgi:ADP-dependent NAD(P)H-hydrate dehydratase / NAD(P)H-hydrate epimerase
MIPVFLGSQTRQIDHLAITKLQIPSLELMENAGRGSFEFLRAVFPSLDQARVLVLCGKGNNGGDAYVVARHCHAEGVAVKIASICAVSELTEDAAVMAHKCQADGILIRERPTLADLNQAIAASDLIIDGLLGTGIEQNVRSPYKDWIERVNKGGKPVFSLDIPSGISADTGKVLGSAIFAQWTASMGLMKLGLVQTPGSSHAGKVQIINIGIPPSLMTQFESPYRMIDQDWVSETFAARSSHTHKGDAGHVLVLGGSPTKLGAALMTSKTCLRSGAGLVTLALPQKAYEKIPRDFLEIMYEPLASTPDGFISSKTFSKIMHLSEGKQVLAVGPGMGVSADTQQWISALLKQSTVPLVIDADGLNNLVGHCDLLQSARVPVVLTPHPGEMARLCETTSAAIQNDRLEVAIRFAKKYSVTLVLKGYRTITATPDGKAYINPTGNPAMASAGMGDCLTGMIAANLAQGIEWLHAITAAVYIHGLAGDRLSERMGDRGVLAGDIIDSIPFILKEFVIK